MLKKDDIVGIVVRVVCEACSDMPVFVNAFGATYLCEVCEERGWIETSVPIEQLAALVCGDPPGIANQHPKGAFMKAFVEGKDGLW